MVPKHLTHVFSLFPTKQMSINIPIMEKVGGKMVHKHFTHFLSLLPKKQMAIYIPTKEMV